MTSKAFTLIFLLLLVELSWSKEECTSKDTEKLWLETKQSLENQISVFKEIIDGGKKQNISVNKIFGYEF